jgi:hypothetical protein
VLAAMGVFHWWWLCNSGGCSGVVCSKSGADLQIMIPVGTMNLATNPVEDSTAVMNPASTNPVGIPNPAAVMIPVEDSTAVANQVPTDPVGTINPAAATNPEAVMNPALTNPVVTINPAMVTNPAEDSTAQQTELDSNTCADAVLLPYCSMYHI